MRIVTIQGSPRPDGNTATVLGMFEEIVRGEGHDVTRFDAAEMNVAGCRSCYACQSNPDEPACVVNDDAQAALASIVDADAIVYATPLYMWGFASGIRALMERHLCLVTGYMTDDKKSLVADKRAALLCASGGPVQNNADLVQEVFDRFCDYGSTRVAAKVMVAECRDPRELGERGERAARQLATAVTG